MRKRLFPFFTSSEGRRSMYFHEGNVYVLGKSNVGFVDINYSIGEDFNYKSKPRKLNVKAFGGEFPIKFACGDYHCIVLTKNNKVYASGGSGSGGKGIRWNNDVKTFQLITALKKHKVLDISCGYLSTYFITDNGVFSCGRNCHGGLGVGTFKNCLEPTKVKLPPLIKVKKVSPGCDFAVYLTEIGEIYFSGYVSSMAFCRDVKRKVPIKVKFNQRIIDVTSGHEHFVIMTCGNELFSLGSNSSKQCGVDEIVDKLTKITFFNKMGVQQVSCGFWYTYVLLRNGDMYGFGANNYGELGKSRSYANLPEKIASNVAEIFGSGHSGFYIDRNGRVFGTGENGSGELGLGDSITKKKWTENKFIPLLSRFKDSTVPFPLLFSLLEKRTYITVTIKCSN